MVSGKRSFALGHEKNSQCHEMLKCTPQAKMPIMKTKLSHPFTAVAVK